MPNLPKTPTRPSRPARADGILVQLTGGGSKQKSLARLQKIVAATLKGRWQVALIHHQDRLYELVRTKPNIQPTHRQAFEMARQLEAHSQIAMAEVGAMVPGADPTLRQVYPSAQSKALAKSFGKDSHRPCSHFEEWALTDTQVQAAWALPLPTGGKPQGQNIVIAHPDTGYTKHPEYFDAARVLVAKGYDFEDNDSHARDRLKGQAPGHGTATGSVIMGAAGDQTPNSPNYVSGVAPRARLIPIRVSTGVVHLSFRRLVRGIYHAIDNRAHIISLSLGGPFYSAALDRAVKTATDKGIIVIAAAGNVWPWVVYPAKLSESIAVAASNCESKPWSQSAAGRAVAVAAPGESVWRAKAAKPNKFSTSRSNGTSYATAITAGACALWLAYHGRSKLVAKYGKQNLAVVFNQLLTTTVRTVPGWKKRKYGAGIIDVRALLAANLPAKSKIGTAQPKASKNSVIHLTELLPESSSSKSKIALANLFHCKPSQLAAQTLPFQQEMRYLLTTNPEFRQALVQNAISKNAKGLGPKALAKTKLLGGRASTGLARRLGMKP